MSFDPPLPPFNSTDPSARFLNVSCLDLLLIELVPMAERMALHGLPVTTNNPTTTTTTAKRRSSQHQQQQDTDHDSTAAASFSSVHSTTLSPSDQETHLSLLHHRLDSLGYRVGLSLSERFSNTYIPLAPTPAQHSGGNNNTSSTPITSPPPTSNTANPNTTSTSTTLSISTLSPRPLFTTPLDAIKFLCKDLWLLLFKKQIDNLKTNHRGVYVLTDNMFRPLTKMSMTTRERNEALERAQRYLWFPCGVIRGVLGSLGIEVSVVAETGELPVATFQIRTVGAAGTVAK